MSHTVGNSAGNYLKLWVLMIIFVHIPKTGGTSIRTAASEHFGKRGMLYDYGREARLTSKLVLQHMYEKPDPIAFAAQAEAQRAQFLAGHFPIQRYLEHFEKACWITWLRDPVKRVISSYRHHLRNGTLGEVDFEAFCRRPSMRNQQFRQSGGELGRFEFVGLLEQFELSVDKLNDTLGTRLAVRRENVAKSDDFQATNAQLDLVARLNRKDLRLIDSARERLQGTDSTARYMLRGVLDHAEPHEVRGWVTAADGATPIRVSIHVNGEHRADVVADQMRNGVAARGIHSTGQCGFQLDLDGDHVLAKGDSVRAVAEGGLELRGSPALVKSDAAGRVFFMHIAKAGGTSINKWFATHYPNRRVALHAESSWQVDDRNYLEHRDFVSGHIRLARWRLYRELDDFVRVTLMRSPLDHICSHIRWLRYIGENAGTPFFERHTPEVKRIASQLKDTDLSSASQLEKFVQSLETTGLNLLDNCQTRYLISNHEPEALEQFHCEDALKNLHKLDIVGTLERLDCFLARVSERLGWEQSANAVPRLNARRSDFGLNDLCPQTRDVLRPLVQFDQVIYDAVASAGKAASDGDSSN